jgi:hypothetical protein
MKRKSNIASLIAFSLWFLLFMQGWSGIDYIYSEGHGIFPNSGQVYFYMVIPALVALAISGCAWVINVIGKGFAILATVSCLALTGLLPFMFAYTGGM